MLAFAFFQANVPGRTSPETPPHPPANSRMASRAAIEAGLIDRLCGQNGRMMARGVGGYKDERSALLYLKKACEWENEDACGELGFYQQYQTFPPEEPGEIEWLFLSTCHAGKMRACIDLGYMFRDSESELLHTHAAVLFQKACEANEQEGCFELGEAYFKGHGVPQDDAKGLKIDTEACHAKYAWACYLLGSRYRDGLGVPPDQYKAVLLLDDACPKVSRACGESEALRERIKAELETTNSEQ